MALMDHIDGAEQPGGAARIRLVGLVDADAVRRELLAVLDSAPCPLEVDLSGVEEIDSGGVAALLRARQVRPVRCVAPSVPAQRILRATGAALVLGVSTG